MIIYDKLSSAQFGSSDDTHSNSLQPHLVIENQSFDSIAKSAEFSDIESTFDQMELRFFASVIELLVIEIMMLHQQLGHCGHALASQCVDIPFVPALQVVRAHEGVHRIQDVVDQFFW